ncbi:MAG TPA: hypothetical protein VF230_00350, partial [Acidimicrobiales bacterium]
MIATVDIADLGVRSTLRSLVNTRLQPANVPGLRWADSATLLPLASTRPPSLRRAALLAFWDDEDAADAFRAEHPVGKRFAGGLRATLRPLRAFGSWPGLADDITASRAVPHEGPVVVFTLGRLRVSQTVRFLRTSRPAENAALDAEGFVWGTAAARPPFVATVSAWASSRDAAAYAYARQRPQHADAITEQQRRDFHVRSAFIRFDPTRVDGALDGTNPVSAAS